MANWEQALLGTALHTPATMELAQDLLPSDFTAPFQLLWAEMLSLWRETDGLDLRTLTERMRETGNLDRVALDSESIRGEEVFGYLIRLRGDDMQMYVDKVLDASNKRQLRQVSALIRADAEDERVPAVEAMDNAEQRLLSLRRNRLVDLGMPLANIVSVFNTRIEQLRAGTLVPSWVPKVDALRRLIHYIDDDDYIICAARPGEGKSSLMRYEFVLSALAGEPCLLFNLENGELEYAKFALSILTGIDSAKMKSPSRLTEEDLYRLREAARALASAPLFIKTLGAPNAQMLERITRQHLSRDHVKRIGVDYIQLVRNGMENKNLDVAETSATLRAMALRYHVPVMANSQMSRQIEHRGDNGTPQLDDLRDSGSLEQDATIVWFPRSLWRRRPSPAEVGLYPENVVNGTVLDAPRAVPIEIHVAKNRNGPTGVTEPILWLKHTNQFRMLVNDNEVHG